MNLSFYIARRYLISKKSHNAINVISLISICGIAIATMAMVCALSVFNGFTDIAIQSFSDIDPDLKITPTKGKVFDASLPEIEKIKQMEQIEFVFESLEENALVRYEDRQVAVTIKGVPLEYGKSVNTEKILLEGGFILKEGDVQYGVIGVQLALTLGARVNFIAPLEIYSPRRESRINLANPASAFIRDYAYPSGIFALNQPKYDDQLVFVSLELARELLQYEKEVTSLDITLKKQENSSSVKKEIKTILGDNYLVKDRFEQQEESFKMVNVEKWVTFFILVFILIIAVFNIIGSLSMLILDKEEDIRILQNLGASNKLIVNIFTIEGWLISLSGTIAGLIMGLTLCLLQQYFGLLKLGEGTGEFIIEAYPVTVKAIDIFLIFLTVSIIGFVAVLYPTNNLRKHLKK